MSMLPRLAPRRFLRSVIEVAIMRRTHQGGMIRSLSSATMRQNPRTWRIRVLRPILERTLGVPLFQEQVMQIAMVGAGYSGGEADQLRRDMAAWRRNGNLSGTRSDCSMGFLRATSHDFCRAPLRADSRLCGVRISREPRGELRAPRVRERLFEAPSFRRVCCIAHQQSADGVLFGEHDRAGRQTARRRGPTDRDRSQRLGCDARARRCVHRLRCGSGSVS